MLTLRLASLQLGLLLSELWKCLKPPCAAVLPMYLASFLSSPSNRRINGGFVGAKIPQMAQPLGTC